MRLDVQASLFLKEPLLFDVTERSGMLAARVFGPGSSRWPCRGQGLLLTQLGSERPQIKALGGPGVPSARSLMLSSLSPDGK